MLRSYLKSKGLWTPTTESENGSITEGTPVTVRCQVVDDERVEGATSGRDASPGPWSVVVVEMSTDIKEGDFFQVTEVRGQSVDRPKRIVRSSNVCGGFRASHREVLI